MVDNDMKMEALKSTHYIKSLITAEMPMDLERKGEQSYQGERYVRFLAFSNGDLESLYDHSDGFYCRQLILSVKKKPLNREDDPFLADKFCAEIEGLFLWCLDGLQKLIKTTTVLPKVTAPRITVWKPSRRPTMCCCSCVQRATSG